MVHVLIDWTKYGIPIKHQSVQSTENTIFKSVLQKSMFTSCYQQLSHHFNYLIKIALL